MTENSLSQHIRTLFAPSRTSRTEILQDVEALARQQGPQVYREIFRFLLGRDVHPNRARRYWRESLARCHRVFQPEHPQTFIRACLLDYLHNVVGEKISSIHDGLTGLHNHPYCLAHLEKLLALRRHENSSAPVTLALMKPDHFDIYELKAGHILADRVLRQIAEIIKSRIQPMDTAALLANGEFALVLPGTAQEELRHLCREMSDEIRGGDFEKTEVLPGGELTVSWGLAGYPQSGDSHQRLLKEATKALTAAAETGNSIFPPLDERRAEPRTEICKVVDLLCKNTGSVTPAVAVNLSAGGLALNSAVSIAPGTSLRLQMRPPFWPVEKDIDARVQSTSRTVPGKSFRLGLRFESPQNELMHSPAA